MEFKDKHLSLVGKLSWLCLGVAVFLLRSIYTVPIESGGDAIRKYLIAHKIATNTASLELLLANHHAARWTINLPTVLVLKLAGIEPWTYYLTPLIFYAVLFVSMIWYASRNLSIAFTCLFAVLLFFEPMMFRGSSQLQPFVFGLSFSFLSGVLAAEYVKQPRNWKLLGSAVAIFLAYGAKMPYAFFIPGILAYIFCQRGTRPCLYFIGVFLFLLLLEYLAFYNLSGSSIPLGRFGVILSSGHFGSLSYLGNAYSEHFWKWFRLPQYNLALIGLTLGLYIYLAYRRRLNGLPSAVHIFLWMVFSWVFFDTFLISSLDPLTTFQQPKAKYLTPLMPLLLYCLVQILWHLVMEESKSETTRPPSGLSSKHLERVVAVSALLLTLLFVSKPVFSTYHFGVPGSRGNAYPEPALYVWRINSDYKNVVAEMRKGLGLVNWGAKIEKIGLMLLLGSYAGHDNIESIPPLRKKLMPINQNKGRVVIYHKDHSPDHLKNCRRISLTSADIPGPKERCSEIHRQVRSSPAKSLFLGN